MLAIAVVRSLAPSTERARASTAVLLLREAFQQAE